MEFSFHDSRVGTLFNLYAKYSQCHVFYKSNGFPNTLAEGSIYCYVCGGYLDDIYLYVEDSAANSSTCCALSYDYALGVYVTHMPGFNQLSKQIVHKLTPAALEEWTTTTRSLLDTAEGAYGLVSLTDSLDVQLFLKRIRECYRGDS